MDKQVEAAQSDSISNVRVKVGEYEPSEFSEPPPAYKKSRASSVEITRIISFTLIACSFILGCFILASSYVESQANMCVQQEYSSVQTSGEALARESPSFQALQVDPLLSDESKASTPIQIKMPVQIDFDDLAAALIEKNQKARMNCVIEKRKSEEMTDHQSKNMALPFGVNVTTDPRYEHVTGERMVIFCESGNDDKSEKPAPPQAQNPSMPPMVSNQPPLHPLMFDQPERKPFIHPQRIILENIERRQPPFVPAFEERRFPNPNPFLVSQAQANPFFVEERRIPQTFVPEERKFPQPHQNAIILDDRKFIQPIPFNFEPRRVPQPDAFVSEERRFPQPQASFMVEERRAPQPNPFSSEERFLQPNGFNPESRRFPQGNGFAPEERRFAQPNLFSPEERRFPQQNGFAPEERRFPQQNGFAPEERRFPQQNGFAPEERRFPQQNGFAPEERRFPQQNGFAPEERRFPQPNGFSPPERKFPQAHPNAIILEDRKPNPYMVEERRFRQNIPFVQEERRFPQPQASFMVEDRSVQQPQANIFAIEERKVPQQPNPFIVDERRQFPHQNQIMIEERKPHFDGQIIFEDRQPSHQQQMPQATQTKSIFIEEPRKPFEPSQPIPFDASDRKMSMGQAQAMILENGDRKQGPITIIAREEHIIPVYQREADAPPPAGNTQPRRVHLEPLPLESQQEKLFKPHQPNLIEDMVLLSGRAFTNTIDNLNMIIAEVAASAGQQGQQRPQEPADTVRPPPPPFQRLPIHIPINMMGSFSVPQQDMSQQDMSQNSEPQQTEGPAQQSQPENQQATDEQIIRVSEMPQEENQQGGNEPEARMMQPNLPQQEPPAQEQLQESSTEQIENQESTQDESLRPHFVQPRSIRE